VVASWREGGGALLAREEEEALARGEEETIGKFLTVGVRALRHFYRARASRQGKFCTRDIAIAREENILFAAPV
jgi:hypothetical protein